MSDQLPTVPVNTRIVLKAPPSVRTHLVRNIESAITRRGLSLDDLRQIIGTADMVVSDDSRAGKAIRAAGILLDVLDSLRD